MLLELAIHLVLALSAFGLAVLGVAFLFSFVNRMRTPPPPPPAPKRCPKLAAEISRAFFMSSVEEN